MKASQESSRPERLPQNDSVETSTKFNQNDYFLESFQATASGNY